MVCHEVGPVIAQRCATMFSTLIQTLSILLVLTATTMAQVHRDPGPSLRERAREFEPLIIESAIRYGIDPRILRSVCFIESRYRNNAISPKGALGLMQFMPETAKRYGLRNPADPKSALDAAAHYLHDLLRKFGGRFDLALAAYNAGEGTVESFQTGRALVLPTGKIINRRGLITGGIPPYRETQEYVNSAIALLRQLPNSKAVNFTPRVDEQKPRLSERSSFRNSTKNERDSLSSANQKSASSFIEVQ